jgi:hypothetical protein
MDHSDAVNLMFYGEATWWIFHARDATYVEQYVKELKGRTDHNDQDFSELFSEEQCFLTSHDFKKIQKKYKVKPAQMVQKPGEAILIPAGCPHQVWEFHLFLEAYSQSPPGFKPERQYKARRRFHFHLQY